MGYPRGRRSVGIPPVGSVVLVDFPFANLTTHKRRPAVVVAQGSLATVILAQVTSRNLQETPSIVINAQDFKSGSLPLQSWVRIDKLVTVDVDALVGFQGVLNDPKVSELKKAIKQLF